MTAVRLLGIPGSIRRGSTNAAILASVGHRLAGNGVAELVLFGLQDVPIYNADLDGDGEAAPPPVQLLRSAIASCDGLIFCTPEFNNGIPGVLKNAIDWASRPFNNSPFKDKPSLIMTSSPASTGGVRAQYQLRETLNGVLARVIATPEIVIPAVHKKFDDGVFADQSSLDFAEAGINLLIAEIEKGRI